MTTIPNNTSTTATIGLDESVQNEIETVGDRDWFRFEVDNSQFVDVSLEGTGFDSINDTYLRVYNSDGVLLDENDDIGSGNLSSELTFFAEADEVYYIGAAGYEGNGQNETGTYTLTTTSVLPPSPLDAITWGVQRDDPVISYYFAPDGVTHQDADGITSDGFNAYERQQFELAFASISAVADVSFIEVTAIDDADFVLILDDDEIRTRPQNQQFSGFFHVASSTQAAGVFNADAISWDRTAGGGLEVGGDGYQTITHELLHGLGLSHPHDAGGTSDILNGVNRAFDDYGEFDLNQGVFTSLSYNAGYRTGDDTAPTGTDYGYDAGPMALDIAVLQRLYGANTTNAAGNNTYVLPTGNDSGTAWQSIWDTGGTDIITFDGTRDVTIDLREATLVYGEGGGGFVSHASGIQGGLTIAAGVIIENARGGAGDDILTGNFVANELFGEGGRDTLIGGYGEDLLDGGLGADNLYGGAGDDDLNGGSGADALYGQSGGDLLDSASGSNTYFGGSGFDEIIGGSDTDEAHGGSGDDVIETGSGSDVLFGGRGDDVMDGGNNNDQLTGGMGTDIMTGGSGADQFIFDYVVDSRVGAQQRDTITDFTNGDRINLANIDADPTVDGDQAFTFVGATAFSGNQGEVRLQAISGDNVIVEVDQNADGIADMEILVIGGANLDQNDFIL